MKLCTTLLTVALVFLLMSLCQRISAADQSAYNAWRPGTLRNVHQDRDLTLRKWLRLLGNGTVA